MNMIDEKWHGRQWLTSRPLVGLQLVLLVTTASLLLLQDFSLAALSGGVWMLCFWAFAFGHTYYQATDQQAPLSREILELFHANDSETDEAFWQQLFATKIGQDMLSFLELPAQALLQTPVAVADTIQSVAGGRVEVEQLVAALLLHPTQTTLLRQHALREEDIWLVLWYMAAQRELRRGRREWWKPEHFLAFTGLGLAWTSGYTPLVDRLARLPVGNLWDTVTLGRAEQVTQLITTLARESQSNTLLIGQPGVGRIGLVKELARRMAMNQAHPAINGYRLLYLHVGELAGFAAPGVSTLTILAQALREMEQAGNVVAVIDGLSSVLAHNPDAPQFDEILVPFFASTTVRSVVIASTEEYHKYLQHNDELAHYFEVVRVESADATTTLQALALAAPRLTQKTGIRLPYKTLRALVRETDGILTDIPYPERAFDMLEEVLVVARGNRQEVLSVADVTGLISRKTGVPANTLVGDERETLLNLEDMMHRRLVNQQQAVQAVSHALVRARTGVRSEQRPIGTFLFLGPTGVGKTETAKTLAEVYFGAEERIIRFDMSEFQSEAGTASLLGSVATGSVGRLTIALSEQPFSVVLLDEFEKAHRAVQQLFLQVFDEGRITDSRGQEVSFRHSLIIATSNAGTEFIRQRGSVENTPAALRNYILTNDIFRPELLNRFDGIITFVPLSAEHIREIAQLMLRKLNKRLDTEHGITVQMTDELLAFLVANGHDVNFGARPMRRLIQDTVEYAVADLILRGHTQPGQKIKLNPAQFESAKFVTKSDAER